MAEFVKAEAMPQYRDILQELLDVEEGLAGWEVDFLETLVKWDGAFTEPQARTLERIYERIFR